MAHPSFQLKQAKNDRYYFVLTAKNGQVIAQSELYNCKAAAENGINSVKENAPNAEIDDQTIEPDNGFSKELEAGTEESE